MVRPPIGQVAQGDGNLATSVPRPLPASKIKYAVQQVGSQSPYQMSIYLEGGAGVAGRMQYPRPVRRIGEDCDGHDIDRGCLPRVHHRDRAGLAPPGNDRCDIEAAHLHVRRRQYPEHVDPAPIDTGLLGRLAQGSLSEIMIIGVRSSARKGDLSSVSTHTRSPLHEHDLWTLWTIADQDQHRSRPSPDARPESHHLVQPGLLRQGGG